MGGGGIGEAGASAAPSLPHAVVGVPLSTGWLHYKTQKSSFMTMGRKKSQFKEYWFILKDGKLTMHKMANTDPISTLELP